MAKETDEKREEPKAVKAKDEDKMPIIKVRSTLPPRADGGHPVALWEKDKAHPNEGEAYVAGPNPVEVAATTEVKGRLRDGTLEEVK